MGTDTDKAIAFYAVLLAGLGGIVSIDTSYHITLLNMLIEAILFVVVMFIVFYFIPKLATKNKQHRSLSIDLEKLRLAEGCVIKYPESKFYNVSLEEYVFTLINESGQDINKCSILLDEHWIRNEDISDGVWKSQGINIFANPFRWNRSNIPQDGKIELENGDRAEFTLIKTTRYPVLNVTENRNERSTQFSLAFFGEDDGVPLFEGWENLLKFSIRAKSGVSENILIKYSLFCRPLSSGRMLDVKLERE